MDVGDLARWLRVSLNICQDGNVSGRLTSLFFGKWLVRRQVSPVPTVLVLLYFVWRREFGEDDVLNQAQGKSNWGGGWGGWSGKGCSRLHFGIGLEQPAQAPLFPIYVANASFPSAF